MSDGILIVDNDLKECEIWKAHLQRQGYDVTIQPFCTQRTCLGPATTPALIMLGISPLQTNFEAISHWINEWRHIPILVLGPTNHPELVACLLDAGADDFVVRSSRRDELLARVRAALRRNGSTRRSQSHVITAEGFVLDLTAKRTFVEGRDIHLTPTEFSLLAELAHRMGEVCTHGELLGKVWGSDYWHASHYLHVYLGRIRRKLGRKYSTLLETVPAMGYILHPSLTQARSGYMGTGAGTSTAVMARLTS